MFIIVGLPGSGKMELASQLSMGITPVFKGFTDHNKIEIERLVRQGENLILVDSWFCSSNNRKLLRSFLIEFDTNIKWIFFENSYKKAVRNLRIQGAQQSLQNYCLSLSSIYKVPVGFDPSKIILL
jgi:hypothetical protein